MWLNFPKMDVETWRVGDEDKTKKITARKIGSNKVREHLRKLEQLLLTVTANGKVFERETKRKMVCRTCECAA
jgi:hypothetical protein